MAPGRGDRPRCGCDGARQGPGQRVDAVDRPAGLAADAFLERVGVLGEATADTPRSLKARKAGPTGVSTGA